jgi:hypothetical protein
MNHVSLWVWPPDPKAIPYRLKFLRIVDLRGELVEQRLGVLQVGGVEALGERIVNVGEYHDRFVTTVGIAEQSCERLACA